MNAPSASAIVVSYNSCRGVLECLRSLGNQTCLHEVIVVDNASHDSTVDVVRSEFPDAKVLALDKNLGFGAAANAGAAIATAEVLLVLNPDVRLEHGAVGTLVDHVARTGDVVAPLTYVGDLGEVSWGVGMDWLGMPLPLHTPGTISYLQGNALAIDAALFKAIGGFDERLFLFVEDVELCWRARLAGRRLTIVREALAYHSGGGTIGGGYVRHEGRTTSDLRFAMRERNTLAVFVACAPAALLAVFIPAHVAKTFATAGVVAVMGRPRLAVDVLRGLTWNLRNIRGSLARRSTAPRIVNRKRAILRYLRLRPSALIILRRDGMPRFVDSKPAARSEFT